MSRVLTVPDVVAIAAVDPGRVTGVARGIFRISGADDIAAAWANRSRAESWECEGTVEEQAAELSEELNSWFIDCNLDGVAIPHMYLVFEDFRLRTQHADLTPVEVTAAFKTRWINRNGWLALEYQSPSDAKSYATNDRLKLWEAWTVGSEHRRDATRHVLLKLTRLMG